MKNNQQSGFILMIVVLVAIALFVIFFAVQRIINANSGEGDSAYSSSYVTLVE